MFRNIIKAIAGDPNKRDIQKYSIVVDEINALEPQFTSLSEDALRAKTDEFRARLAQALAGIDEPKERQQVEQETLEALLPEAFATVREAAIRTISQRHYDVQLIGGMALHQGKIAEMRTGEGKTLVSTLPAYLNALTGRGVHIVTVNDYLARRDARWMQPIYEALGLTVGVLQEAARTENGRKAFVVDPTRENKSNELSHKLRLVERREAYAADIVYGTNHEFGFDYLRDNMAWALDQRVQRERYCAIVDEVDNILIDEARTPLIISGPAQEDPSLYYQLARVVRQLRPEDYEIDERGRGIALTEVGEAHLEKILGQPLGDPERPEELTPEQSRMLGHIEQALRAEFIFKKDKDYAVVGGGGAKNKKIVIIDEFTGRMMEGRRWSDGLHQAVEAKEGVVVQQDNVTYATITLQNFFRLYQKLAGMTGTALTEAEEFDKNYKLAVVAIPTNLEYQVARATSGLAELEGKEDGFKYHYFVRQEDAEKKPVFWRRKDYADMVYRTEEAKLRALTQEVLRRHLLGQPLLVGTTSVELSERISDRLRPDPLQRLAQVLLIRQAWFEKNNREEDGMVVQELKALDAKLSELNRSELAKQMKELGLSTNPAGEENLGRLAQLFDLPEAAKPELLAALQGGIRHNVLNAKEHDREATFIARAGEMGAVTIATNMAGRGVDIKLGGELDEQVLTDVNRVLKRAGVKDPYDLTHEQRQVELREVPESDWGIYDAECRVFMKMMEDAAQVKNVGGLHVIGSERHEARRIDNQLRGRAARQGDPGSSQFYLSLEDDLMRRFGGQQVSDLMQRLNVDEGMPIQAGVVNRVIEQSQTRVEGFNFDMRKHLLEYDDVLNTQRNKIYSQRDRIFTKDDLTEDFLEMLEAEVERRVSVALADEAEGLWKLLAWLEDAQPSIPLGQEFYPSYMLELLLRDLEEKPDKPAALLDLARAALDSEGQHLRATVEAQVDAVEARLQAQAKERRAEAELALETLENEAHENQQPVDGRAALRAVGEALGLNLQASAAELREFDLNKFKKQIPGLAETAAAQRLRQSLMAGVERRLGAPLSLSSSVKNEASWDAIREQMIASLEQSHQAKTERVLAEIERDLNRYLPPNPSRSDLTRALLSMVWGATTDYDQKHKKVRRLAQRLNYLFVAAERLGAVDGKQLPDEVMAHLRGAYDLLYRKLGPQVFTAHLRQIMLYTIGGLWVEYLTSVEALRTSIGLEAYAQRDPLVAYKSKAFELFQELLVNMRAGVVARAFRVSLPGDEAPAARGPAQAEAPEALAAPAGPGAAPQGAAEAVSVGGGKGRQRHKRH